MAQNGYHGMTMRALARATGRSLATAYNYFSSKEEILYALQKEAFEALIGAARRALEDVASPSSRLYVFILNHISYFTAHADVMRVSRRTEPSWSASPTASSACSIGLTPGTNPSVTEMWRNSPEPCGI